MCRAGGGARTQVAIGYSFMHEKVLKRCHPIFSEQSGGASVT